MKSVEFGEQFTASVTVMRRGDAMGISAEQLDDGNVLPRLCSFAGENACARTCQLKLNGDEGRETAKLCAENNILEALSDIPVNPENFAMISATKDRVGFADDLESIGATRHSDGYTMVPECNAFFFRPNRDMTFNRQRRLTHVAMRMADCGDVVYNMKDREGDDVVGIAHFSRTNMRGPSTFMHDKDDRKVSWSEYVLGSAVDHFGADPASVKVKLVAAVERDDFVHHYQDVQAMVKHYPGWAELGFMHPQGGQDFDCLIDYREMIQWQLSEGIQNPDLRLDPTQIDLSEVINTGDITLGHASHHQASKGTIAHGRDMYVVGLNQAETIKSRIDELETLQQGRRWSMGTFGEMTDDDYAAFTNLVRTGDQELAKLRAFKPFGSQ